MLRGGDEAWWGGQSTSFLGMIRRRLSAAYTFPENFLSLQGCGEQPPSHYVTSILTPGQLPEGSQMSLPRAGKHEVDQGTCLACGGFLGHLLWASFCF